LDLPRAAAVGTGSGDLEPQVLVRLDRLGLVTLGAVLAVHVAFWTAVAASASVMVTETA
jgi:hypothetical protein